LFLLSEVLCFYLWFFCYFADFDPLATDQVPHWPRCLSSCPIDFRDFFCPVCVELSFEILSSVFFTRFLGFLIFGLSFRVRLVQGKNSPPHRLMFRYPVASHQQASVLFTTFFVVHLSVPGVPPPSSSPPSPINFSRARTKTWLYSRVFPAVSRFLALVQCPRAF